MTDTPLGDTPAVAIVDEASTNIAGTVRSKFEDAETGRYQHEQRWLKAYKNFRGIYDSTTQFRESEKSRVFLKITKTKVLAAYGQIIDVLFANKRFPIVVEGTPVPEGVAEFAHLKTTPDIPEEEPMQDPYGFPGDGREFEPGATEASPLGGLQQKYEGANLEEGPSRLGEPQISPSRETARLMEKTIHDQLHENNASNVLRHSIFECALLGTGIVKGPLNESKTLHRWDEEDNYSPEQKVVPKIESVSCWSFYPDPAATSIDDCSYIIQRHRLNRSQVRDLMDKPFFNPEAVAACLDMGPNYDDKYFEDTIRSENLEAHQNNDRYEILEFWGNLDSHLVQDMGIPMDMDDLTEIPVNVWVCGNQVLRVVMNPFVPYRIPYFSVPYEINPYQLFGVGIPENMEDAQLLMNGHIRMAIDNLALAGNVVFDVDEASLVPGQNYDIYPGKVFRRQSGNPGTSINAVKFPNTAPENIQMYQAARQLADEETGLPSIMHGQTGVSGTGRTAAGLSMLMGGANLSIKTVIKNIDDFLLKPMGESMFLWNMQFNDKRPEIKGDLEIKPQGTSAVMQKEVRSQRLTALLQTVANPMLAPFIKIPNLVRELAIAQDIDPDLLVNDINDAQIFAEILRGLNAGQGNMPEASPTGQPAPSVGQSGGLPQGTEGQGQGQAGAGTIGLRDAEATGQGAGNQPPPIPQE
tara:strand:- start:312 stop:2396 length:2085 start_codon:yes stop_codon:yes gene_type:complete